MMSNVVRTRSAWLVVVLVVALGAGCATRTVELPPVYKASFDYEATRQGEGAEAISIALLEPHWSAGAMERSGGKLSDVERAFQDGIGRALLNYFTVNNFAVSGPFRSLEDMTFPEKKQVDLVLEVEIDYSASGFDWQVTEHRSSWDGSVSHTYAIDSELSFTGGLSTTLWEPLSGQRMWTKLISMDGESVRVYLEKTDYGDLADRVGINAYRELLDLSFAQVMRQVERYFHPDEVRLVKTQAQELREKKVY